MSMIAVKWFSKDGMSTDPGTWCGNNFLTDGELDNDWVLLETKLPYDANTKTLNANFKRELIGSTSKDFTYKIGEKYDYKLTYGLWATTGTTDAAIGKTSEADPLIGGVLIPGAEAPKLVTKPMLKLMKRGSVIVDVAIDQGGCVETSKPTTHGEPTYIIDGIVHYCVANMPGGVPRTSTIALNTATLPYLVKLANKGYKKALSEDKNFLAGLNVCNGKVTYKAVADVFGYDFVEPVKAF